MRVAARALYLVIAAVLAAAALAASASGATICEAEGNAEKKCAPSQIYPARPYKAVVEGKVEFTTTTIIMKCNESTFLGKTTESSAEPLPGELSTLTFSGEDCTKYCESVTALNLSYAFKVKPIDGKRDGEVVFSKGGGGSPPKLQFTKCGFLGISCEFTAQADEFTLKLVGGSPGKLIANEVPFKYSGGSPEMACGASRPYKATYKITEPAAAVFVTQFP